MASKSSPAYGREGHSGNHLMCHALAVTVARRQWQTVSSFKGGKRAMASYPIFPAVLLLLTQPSQ